jgi:hypothetical protein
MEKLLALLTKIKDKHPDWYWEIRYSKFGYGASITTERASVDCDCFGSPESALEDCYKTVTR